VILGLDHVGLLTGDISAVGAKLGELGLSRVEAGLAHEYGVACEFWQHDESPESFAIELVAPVREDSSVANRLERQGPGLYHVALEVDDLAAEAARLRRSGFVPIDSAPVAGAREGMQVMFLYLGKPANLMIELVRYDVPRRAAGRG
jgi:methylmalonyl-CoA/ethylmalonyl-CoA epimerase